MRLWWLQRAAALLPWNVLHKRCVHTKLCWEAFVSHLSRVWGLVVVMHQEVFVWISRAWRIPLRHAETHIHTHTLGFTQSRDRGSVQSSTNRIHLWSLISSNWNFSPEICFVSENWSCDDTADYCGLSFNTCLDCWWYISDIYLCKAKYKLLICIIDLFEERPNIHIFCFLQILWWQCVCLRTILNVRLAPGLVKW